jgi:ribosomal-protein-alanine N-acetyltransferase
MLETTRLILRPAVLSDAQNLLNLNSDIEVVRYTGDRSFSGILEAQELIQTQLMPQFLLYKMGRFMVFLKNGPFIGWCGLRYYPPKNEVDLGYRLMKKYWGMGFATEASEVCLKYGLKTLGLQKILGKSMPENVRSLKVLKKLGMSFKGYHRDPSDPVPFIVYEISQSEYKACEES